MSTKREAITTIVNKYVTYGQSQEFPFFDNKEKIAKFKRDYTTDHLAGLIVKYIIPAHKQGTDFLRGYMKLELDRLRALGVMTGVDESVVNFQLTTEQEDHTVNCLVEIIDVIQG
jgi:hypothetical protein